jgi:SulP family sulfate permease
MNPATRYLPQWMRDYPKGQLGTDVSAGLIVAVLVIPQSLAYALLAGLPPQVGLYVGIFPVIAYALLGSSRVLAVGPVAVTAIMTWSMLSPIAVPGSAQYVVLAAGLALLSGLILLLCGVLRLGFLSQLLSRPVIAGFVSGSAILIVASQLGRLTGLALSGSVASVLTGLATQLTQAHLPTLAIGFMALSLFAFTSLRMGAVLVRAGLSARRALVVVRLTPLAVVALGTLAVLVLDLDGHYGVAVVGAVSEGLPGFELFLPDFGMLKLLTVPAFIMALIGMVQGISVAQAMAIKRRERIDANAELVGLGSANVVAAFYGGMPVGGGLTRSAVNVAAGAQSPLASIITALAMVVIVVGLAPTLARLPLAVLAAAIIVAALSMIDLRTLREAWNYDRADAIAYVGTAVGVLAFGLEVGIMAGVLFSMGVLLFYTSQPHIAVIGRIAGSEHFRNFERYAVDTIPGVLFVRVDERLFFGNLAAVERRLMHELGVAEGAGAGVRDLVLVMSAVNRMDATSVDVFRELNQDLADRSVRLHLAEVKGPVQDRLMRSPLWTELSGEVFLSANEAFEKLR